MGLNKCLVCIKVCGTGAECEAEYIIVMIILVSLGILRCGNEEDLIVIPAHLFAELVSVALVEPSTVIIEQCIAVYPSLDIYGVSVLNKRITVFLCAESGNEVGSTLNVRIIEVVYELAVLTYSYNRNAGRSEDKGLCIPTVADILVLTCLLELLSHIEKCVPIPFTLAVKLVRIRETCFFDYASSVIPKLSYLVFLYRTVHLSAPLELLAEFSPAVPFGTAHIDYIIDRLEHLLVCCQREHALFKLIYVRRITRSDHLSELIITCTVCVAYPLNYLVCIVTVGSIAFLRDTVVSLEDLAACLCFVISPAAEELKLLLGMKFLIDLYFTCRSL